MSGLHKRLKKHFVQVAEVSGPDGYAYLIGKLLATWSDGGQHPEPLSKVIHQVLSTSLSQNNLKLAVVEGFSQSSLPVGKLPELVSAAAVKTDHQLTLALTLCTGGQGSWSQAGMICEW